MAIEVVVVGLPEEVLRRTIKKFLPFCSGVLNAPFCPIKQKLRKKQSEVSMVKIPQHKVTKWEKFFNGSFIFFEQSGTKTFTAAVYSRFYKSVEKDSGMRTGKIEILDDYFSKRLTLKATYQFL